MLGCTIVTNWSVFFRKLLLKYLKIPEKSKIDIGINKINDKAFFPLKFEKKINGKILNVKTIMFTEKLPTNVKNYMNQQKKRF